MRPGARPRIRNPIRLRMPPHTRCKPCRADRYPDWPTAVTAVLRLSPAYAGPLAIEACTHGGYHVRKAQR